MKKIILLLAFVFTLNAFGQYKRQNVIKTGVLRDLVGYLNIQYEHAFTDKSSLNGLMFFNNDVIKLDNTNSIETSSFGIDIGYRYYYLKKHLAPKGLYVSPGLTFQMSSIDGFTGDAVGLNGNYTEFGIFGVAGYQYIFKFGLTFDVYIGFKSYVSSADIEYEGEKVNVGDTGTTLDLGLTIGYAF